MGFSEEEIDILAIVYMTTSIIGALGGLFIIIIYSFKPDLRCFEHRLVLYVGISDFLSNLSNLIGPYPGKDTTHCMLQAIGISIFDLSGILWVDVMAEHLYRCCVRKDRFIHVSESYECKRICFVALTCGLLAALPFSTDSYGESSIGYCWVDENSENSTAAFIWQMVQFYVPLWISFMFTTYCFWKVAGKITQIGTDIHRNPEVSIEIQNSANKLKWFPLVMIFAWSFGTVNRVYLILHTGNPNFVLAILHISLANLIGLWNFIAWYFNPHVRKSVRDILLCRFKQNAYNEPEAQDIQV